MSYIRLLGVQASRAWASGRRSLAQFSDPLDLEAGRARVMQILVGMGTALIGVIGLLSAPSEEYSGWRVGVVVALSLSAFPVALRWFMGGWPSQRWLVVFIVYSDVSITIGLLCKEAALSSIGGTVLFAVVTALAVVAVPLLPCAVHLVCSIAVLGVVVLRTVHADEATGWVIAAHSLTMLLMFVSPLILMVYVSELRSRARESLVDPLTGLHNRRGLFAAVAAATVTTPPREPQAMAAVAADVDGMKGVNDSYGHHIGDAVLVDVAQHLRALAGDHWIVARLGGDEFACVVVGRSAEISFITSELVNSLARARMMSGLTVSVGSASVHVDVGGDVQQSALDVLRLADSAMYRSKRTRRPA